MAGEPTQALCWGEEVEVCSYLVGRVEVVEERRWALWMVAAEAVLLGLWREVGGEELSFEEVVVLWMVEVEVHNTSGVLVVGVRF